MTNLLDTPQIIERVKAILLNKVVEREWLYYSIVLNKEIADNNEKNENAKIAAQKFLNKLELIDGFKGLYRLNENVENNPTILVDSIPEIDTTVMHGLLLYLKENPEILSGVMQKIFDINEVLDNSNDTIKTAKTNSSDGELGKFNEDNYEKRKKYFEKKMRAGHRSNPQNVVIMAEGDSWFQFPYFFGDIFLLRNIKWNPVKDIIDHLMEYEKYAILSLAAGGDWLSNMLDLKTRQYIEGLEKYSPDVFLVSGGGNDMLSDLRLAVMVRNIKQDGFRPEVKMLEENSTDKVQDLSLTNIQKLTKALLEQRRLDALENKLDFEKYKRGFKFVSDDFFRFINVCLIQYFTMFYNLFESTDRYKKMLVITQGYDFAIPNNIQFRKGLSFFKYLIPTNWVRKVENSGKHLYGALAMKGILDEEDQKAITYVLIHEFNEMMIKLAKYDRFPNVFHIDSRGSASSEDWFDELHLTSDGFKRVSNAFIKCIDEHLPKLQNSIDYQPDEQMKVIRT